MPTTEPTPATTIADADAGVDAEAEADAPAPYTGPTRAIPFYFHIPPHSSSTTTSSTTTPTTLAPTPAQRLTHTHAVPLPLLSSTPSNADADLFIATLSDALAAHRDECFGAAAAECEICGVGKGDVLLTPVSFLHVGDGGGEVEGTSLDEGGEGRGGGEGEDKDAAEGKGKAAGKRVDVLVTPVCGRETCEVLARQKVRRVVEGLQTQQAGEGQQQEQEQEGMELGIKEGPADPRCKTCGRTEGTRKCTGCGRVRYCGRECQKKDWKVHKRLCGGL
ncbi:uncharacterized protein K452DRAFT_128238 [Aplosporella prunicola CBS 121167]|uniref:MYND-type domain-containing protein n=1 Tax=Aplosporella prunicola CBS 121167 TaxID=1176127 RepID=A0A6A6AX90_9PEZI|nr:uncharacterized protein K452DRAFT_128238 [Aplosporella prunicola CBS 121167]KAF2136549.1 hypothetical protein K452DRAFT_128238 [Aplosporella prunicola CBS 121167]